MRVFRSALLACAVALVAPPAWTTERASIRLAEPGAAAAQLDAVLLPPQAVAVQESLLPASGDGPVETAVLDELRAFYADRDFEPFWLRDREATPQMNALRIAMDSADAFGLEPAHYRTPDFAPIYLDDARLGAADVEFSRAVARFVTHLASGRIAPSEISRIISMEPRRPHLADTLSRLAEAEDVAAALRDLEPPHPQYHALKAKLAELRASPAGEQRLLIGAGVLLIPGAADARAPMLRERLRVALQPDQDGQTYDAALSEAVKAFQAENGLTADGFIGPRTLAALNGPDREQDIATIVVNLERWRWMPRDLGAFHVFVNVPEYIVRVVAGGAMVHETRAVVGTPANATPIFSRNMDHIVVNPFWNVPTSILSNEILPEVRQNPGYFSRRGYQVLARAGGKMRVVNPNSIDWWSVNPRAIRIRQVPGDANALGRIKFMFPNQHSVYLHDTPSKALFSREDRALSHGCVRVDDPLAFAAALLPVAAPEWNAAHIEKLYGGKERRINLDTPIPVHLSYFTMTVDASGGIRRFQDIYGYDKRMAGNGEVLQGQVALIPP